MLLGIALAVAALQTTSGQFSDSLTTVSFATGGSYATSGLATTDMSYDIATLTLTNSASTPSTSASINTTFTIYWTPTASGQTPPAAAAVEIGRNYNFGVSGAGTCALIGSDGSTLDSVDGTDQTFSNGVGGMFATDSYTVPLTTNADGSAQGTLTVTSDIASANYDTTNAAPTTTAESVSVASISPATLGSLHKHQHKDRSTYPKTGRVALK